MPEYERPQESAEDWQFKQMVVAIKWLFTEMVEVPWSRGFDWEKWMREADSIDNSHATVTRDYQKIDIESIIQRGIDAKNEDLFNAVFKLHPEK